MNWIPGVSSILIGAATVLAAGSLPAVWDAITRRDIADLRPTIQALGIDEAKLPTLLRWWGILLLTTFFLLVIVLRMFPLAIPALVLVYLAPRLYLRWLIGRRQVQIRDQLVSASIALANTARAGMSLAQGFESVARETPKPLAAELRRIVSDYQRGLPLPRAINSVKERLQIDSFTLFSAAVLTCLERGGRVTEALDRISRSLQENQRIERKMESETASGRKVVGILAVFPLFFLGLFFLVYPEGTAMLFTSMPGQVILSLVIMLVFVSVRWSFKILAIEA
jgi:tight adherence protein B